MGRLSVTPNVDEMMFPPELSSDVNRTAIVLYAYALAFADSSGFCQYLRSAGAWAALGRKEQDQAMADLEGAGYIKVIHTPCDIGGTITACQLLRFRLPLRQERLSPEAWRMLRADVFERDNYTCQYCGERGGKLECDHIEPISKGGTNEMGNLATACARCNRKKHAKLLQAVA